MKSKQKPSAKKVGMIILVVVLAVIFTLLLAATVYVEWMLSRFYYDPAEDVTLSEEQKEEILSDDQGSTMPSDAQVVIPEDVDWAEVETVEPEDYIFNVLLVGQDRRPGELRARSDTMMLITVNTKEKNVTMTSFLRDLYVQIPGYYQNRLNVPYALEGINLLYDTMEQNFGIRPDKFVEVDFDGFQQIVDLVGGVDIDLTANEAWYLNRYTGWGLKEGVNHLDGEKALEYARIRSLGGNGDFGRTQRQRNVISALIDKATTLDLLTLNDLLLSMSDIINTDMNSAEIISYAAKFYPMLGQLGEPASVQIPADGTYYLGWVDGIGSVVVSDLEANSAIVAQTQD